MEERVFECPTCGRVARSDKGCTGTVGDPHARADMVPAGHMIEALHLDAPLPDRERERDLRD